MERLFAGLVFLLGAALIAWLAAGFAATSTLALVVTLAIAVAYVIGFVELWVFQRDTRGLQQALQPAGGEPLALDAWLMSLPPALRSAAGKRVQGEPVALPAPLLTPYLTGLLVMLGLLGTFIGMMIALQGAVGALEGSTELAAIRAGLTAPIKGLSMAFGTSVAGVAASAALGLLSALARRQRLAVSRLLDTQAGLLFPGHSPLYYRQEMLQQAREHTRQLPAVAEHMAALVAQVDNSTERLHARLLDDQQGLQQKLLELHSGLMTHVGQSLRESFADSGRQAGESLAPVLQEAMRTLTADVQATQIALRDSAVVQAKSLAAVHEQAAQSVQNTQAVVTAQAAAVAAQDSLRAELAKTVSDSRALLGAQSSEASALLQQLSERFVSQQQQLEAQWLGERAQFDGRQLARHESLSATVQAALTQALTANAKLTADTLGPVVASSMAALDSAVAHVRDEAAAALQRDQTLLASQRELVAELGSVTRGLADDSAQYRSTLERFSEHTSGLLQSTAAGFAASVEQGADRLAEVSEQFAAGAIELATLGDAMGGAVAQFDAVSAHLSSTLQGVAQGMQEAAGRSDEQLAYYVAQAREVIDHSALAQQKLLDQLREISRSV